MPALGMAQETGLLVSWLKSEGETVAKDEPIMEVETDKATLEIAASASGILAGVSARPGDNIPVGQTIAWILAAGETLPAAKAENVLPAPTGGGDKKAAPLTVSPVAQKIAQEHGIDLAQVKPGGGRVEKADVLAYVEAQKQPAAAEPRRVPTRVTPASPKARRMATEMGLDVATLTGSGPDGAVLAADVLSAPTTLPAASSLTLSNAWHIMAQRVTQSWTSAPHFYLLRDVNASRLAAWRSRVQEQTGLKVTYTDLLVRLVASALRTHPRLNAHVKEGQIILHGEINLGLAVAVSDGLVVPVLHRADELNLEQIAARNHDLAVRAHAGKLRLEELQGGTFTLSNLGMFGVDGFNAIINPPQAAILAVGRIAERVVPVNGLPAVQPMMTLSLSCDHRALDGALGARFLDYVANLIEEPLILL
ncbi:MAG: 2-oxo acid dehydrogenase subunit E2 [Chloroflexi bacterium]|nr:2-oxo acid dehydrogenase subunit E2 [Chloroflexota bacterium]